MKFGDLIKNSIKLKYCLPTLTKLRTEESITNKKITNTYLKMFEKHQNYLNLINTT